MSDKGWPPPFTLDQEKILNLLTGDRFYSDPSAALREAVLNAIDAVHRRRKADAALQPKITVTFDRDDLTVAVADNGIGMSRDAVGDLFTTVGASAANAESNPDSVGEFGIGVISYFMAGDAFDLQTNDGAGTLIGLAFERSLLTGGAPTEIAPTKESQGTTAKLRLKDAATFAILLDSFPHWCRDVEGLSGRLLPDDRLLSQGGAHRPGRSLELPHPEWVERCHLGPVAEPTGWEAMTGASNIAVLYRGVFVQEFEIRGIWGIEGSIDVDPKHFKPRLNREGFVQGEFQAEVEHFLGQCHPPVLEAMAGTLARAFAGGVLDKWNEARWASLWLSVPRSAPYAAAVRAWDTVFRQLPAFELAVGNKWQGVSLEHLQKLGHELFVAPLPDEKPTDVVRSAIHYLRNTGHPVVRGVRKDRSWMPFAKSIYRTTADLISAVFADELPVLKPIARMAQEILGNIEPTAPLFTGPPPVDLINLGVESPPALRLKNRLLINTDHAKGVAIVRDALRENTGPVALVAAAARHAHEQLPEVAAAVRAITGVPEILSPVRRRFILQRLS